MAAETSQTLDRGLRVLRTLAATPSGLSITALAAEIGVNRTVVYRLVATLEQHGLARRDAGGRLHVGLGRAVPGPRSAAGAPRARRPGPPGAGRGARQHRPPHGRRRRRGAGHRGRRAELDRLPRGLPGRAPVTRWSRAPRARRSCSAARTGLRGDVRRDAGGDPGRRARRRGAGAAASRGWRHRSASCRWGTSTLGSSSARAVVDLPATRRGRGRGCRERLPRPPRAERARGRHRGHPRQGHRDRRLRPGLGPRHRAAHRGRPRRHRQRGHLPAVRRGHQPARRSRTRRAGCRS